MSNKVKKLENELNRSGWLTNRWGQGEDVDAERKECNREIAELIAEIADYEEKEEPEEPNGGEWKPDFPDRKKILDMPVYDEYNIHYMTLAGWAYRNIEAYPDMVRTQIYELARRTRKAGAKYLRSFLINGSRDKKEKHDMRALPWITWRRMIDFSTPNDKYWEVVQIIEEACKYWRIHHRPTFRMARYNRDIFRAKNNEQGVEGEYSDHSAKVTIAFMRKFMRMQKEIRNPKYKPAFEFMNEPICWGDHKKLGMVADYHLKLWNGVKDLTVLRKAMTCSGQCEGSHLNLVEKGHYFGRDFGSHEYRHRKVIPEFHGVSTLQSLYDNSFEDGLHSGWRHLAYNEDAANVGSYSPIPWTRHRQANSEELYDMLYHGHSECRRKGKKFIFTAFCMGVLRKGADGIAKEDFNPSHMNSMNWNRLGQYKKVRQELG